MELIVEAEYLVRFYKAKTVSCYVVEGLTVYCIFTANAGPHATPAAGNGIPYISIPEVWYIKSKENSKLLLYEAVNKQSNTILELLRFKKKNLSSCRMPGTILANCHMSSILTNLGAVLSQTEKHTK
jgi:hypothetical protein